MTLEIIYVKSANLAFGALYTLNERNEPQEIIDTAPLELRKLREIGKRILLAVKRRDPSGLRQNLLQLHTFWMTALNGEKQKQSPKGIFSTPPNPPSKN